MAVPRFPRRLWSIDKRLPEVSNGMTRCTASWLPSQGDRGSCTLCHTRCKSRALLGVDQWHNPIMLKEFGDDGSNEDERYLRWLADHPGGFVLNCNRSPKPSYLVLHRATCWSISGTPSPGQSWTREYRKICADTVSELEKWASPYGVPWWCGAPGPCSHEDSRR